MLAQIDSLCARWHAFREGRSDRATVLALWLALWLVVTVDGVEPSNTAVERALRPAVLWRKGCFGAQSAAGNRFVERILTVSATCQQQNRHLCTFLTDAVAA